MVSEEKIFEQATQTATYWMEDAVKEIDLLFGEGYARSNPVLVGQFIQTAALDQLGMYIHQIADVLHTFPKCTE